MKSSSSSQNDAEIETHYPVVGKLRRYWDALNGGRIPSRNLIDPAAILDILPHIMIVEFESPTFRVRYRLTGTLVDSATGFNLTGHYLDEYLVDPIRDDIQRLIDAYERVCRSGLPEVGIYTWGAGARPMMVGYGMFPLDVDGRVQQAIVAEQEWQRGPMEEIPTWRQAIEGKVVEQSISE